MKKYHPEPVTGKRLERCAYKRDLDFMPVGCFDYTPAGEWDSLPKREKFRDLGDDYFGMC